MTDLRTQLDRKARDFSPDDDGLERLLVRAERRHRGRRITSGLVALVVAAGGTLGIYSMVGGGRTILRAGDGQFAAIWPQDTRQDAEAAQTRADAGDTAATWQTDGKAVIERFAAEAAEWVIVDGELSDEALAGDGPFTTSLLVVPFEDCKFTGVDPDCQEDGQQDAEVTIERLIQQGPGGIWSVTAATIDGRPVGELGPPDDSDQGNPDEGLGADVRAFLSEFMESRRAGTSFAEEHLAWPALAAFDSNEGGLELYEYVRTEGARWVIDSPGPDPDTGQWPVQIRIFGEGPLFPDSGSIVERLVVGSTGDGGPLQVLTAERTE